MFGANMEYMYTRNTQMHFPVSQFQGFVISEIMEFRVNCNVSNLQANPAFHALLHGISSIATSRR